MIVVSLCMVYSDLDIGLATVKLRKHAYRLLCSVFMLILQVTCIIIEFLGSVWSVAMF